MRTIMEPLSIKVLRVISHEKMPGRQWLHSQNVRGDIEEFDTTRLIVQLAPIVNDFQSFYVCYSRRNDFIIIVPENINC